MRKIPFQWRFVHVPSGFDLCGVAVAQLKRAFGIAFQQEVVGFVEGAEGEYLARFGCGVADAEDYGRFVERKGLNYVRFREAVIADGFDVHG